MVHGLSRCDLSGLCPGDEQRVASKVLRQKDGDVCTVEERVHVLLHVLGVDRQAHLLTVVDQRSRFLAVVSGFDLQERGNWKETDVTNIWLQTQFWEREELSLKTILTSEHRSPRGCAWKQLEREVQGFVVGCKRISWRIYRICNSIMGLVGCEWSRQVAIKPSTGIAALHC